MHIVLAGGGTAGHIEPALNTADEIRSRNCGDSISILGTSKGLETTLVPARGYQLTLIPPVPLPRRINKDLFTLPSRLHDAIGATKHHLIETKADVVVGFGGYVALPAYFAARSLNIPIVVHEANAKPGLANKVGARFATKVVETVKGSISGAVQIGLPLRYPIAHFDKAQNRSAGLGLWNLDENRPTILVFGGSQGARVINDAVAQLAPELIANGFQILHSVGRGNEDQMVRNIPSYTTVPYIDKMEYAYGVADLVVSRSGAMTVAEICAVGLPAIFIPFAVGNGEQILNAKPVVDAGGGLIIENQNLNSQTLHQAILKIQSLGLENCASASRSLGNVDSAKEFVDLILQVAR
jgi:UDP-N-acetylglucosamine--N-acetylmuramyl-(pentapeptide) pyrophosphoryl-undecaprenol N-acetylglucosamine transferase